MPTPNPSRTRAALLLVTTNTALIVTVALGVAACQPAAPRLDTPRVASTPQPVATAPAPLPVEPAPVLPQPIEPPRPVWREPGDADLDLVREALTADPDRLAAIADELDASIGGDAVAALAAHALPRAPLRPGVVKKVLLDEEGAHPFAIVLPRGYSPEGPPWPLHVNLHGGGKRSDHRTCMLQWRIPKHKPFILLCPSFPQGRWWTPEGDATLRATLRVAQRDLNIDPDRVTLGGMSNGGTGTWHLAIKYPWLWAAITPRAAAHIPDEDYDRNLVPLPTLLIHARDDKQIDLSHATWMVDTLTRLGAPPTFIEEPRGGHHFLDHLNPRAVEFLQAHTRALPAAFTYTPIPGALVEQLYWVRAPMTSTLKAALTIEGDTATIDLDAATFPPSLTLYLPPTLANPDAVHTVRVRLNGRLAFQGPPRQSARFALDTLREGLDPGRTWSRGVVVTPP